MKNDSYSDVGGDLKGRYIYAVVRHLPVKARADVERELDGLISEMLDERRGNDAPSEQDLKDALAELGTPEELALKYCGSDRKALISGTYFLLYKRVLFMVLPIVAAISAAGMILGLIFGAEPLLNIGVNFGTVTFNFGLGTFLAETLRVIASAAGGAFQAFAIITVVFAVLDYRKVDLQDGDMFDNLPEIPEAKAKIEPFWSIVGIAVSIPAAVLFLLYPQIISARFEDIGWIPVFNVDVVHSLWLPILLWAILNVGSEIMELVEGQYTMRLASVTAGACALIAICAAAVFGNSEIINPVYTSRMLYERHLFDGAYWVFDIVAQPNHFIMAVTFIVLAYETVWAFVKAFQSGRS